MVFRILARASDLARVQTDLFCQSWCAMYPDTQYRILPMTTQGDKTQGSIAQLKNAFTGDLRQALLDCEGDVAVHSLKDVSVVEHEHLCLAAVMERADPRDVFVSDRYSDLAAMPPGALVGTSSARRAAQIKVHYPDLRVVSCRGNVLTRLTKLRHGECDAVILAAAGLQRLGLFDLIRFSFLPVETFTPACAQGVVCAEVRSGDAKLLQILQSINHVPTFNAIVLEREIVRRLGANCGMPVGVFVEPKATGYQVTVFVGSLSSVRHVQYSVLWPFSDTGYVVSMDFLLKCLEERGVYDLIGHVR